MKQNFFKFFLVALVSVLGVSNAFADWQRVYYVAGGDSVSYLGHGPSKLCDGNNTTKWLVDNSSDKYVIFKTNEPIVLKSYKLINGNDANTYPNRSWKSWKLYGSTSADGFWTLLDEVTKNPQAVANYEEEIHITLLNEQSFQFYKIVLDSWYGDTYAQMGEILVGEDHQFTIKERPLLVDSTLKWYKGEQPKSQHPAKYLIDAEGVKTKWCSTSGISGYLTVRTSSYMMLKSHIFYSGDDTGEGDLKKRQMTEWKLYGSNDKTNWKEIFHETGTNPTSDKDSTATTHPVNCNTSYVYYKFEPIKSADTHENPDARQIQLSDFWVEGIIDPHAIVFNANGGSGEMDAHVTYNYGEVALSNNQFVAPANKVFVGWNTQADGQGAAYLEGNKLNITASTQPITKLYAQWADKAIVESLLKPVEVNTSSLNGNCVIGENEVPGVKSQKVFIDSTGSFFSKESKFTTWPEITGDKEDTSRYYKSAYGMRTQDTISDVSGIRVPFQYAWTGVGEFDGNDAIHLTKANQTQTLDLKNPVAFEKLYFCAMAGGVMADASTITVTVTYTDNTTNQAEFSVKDWFQKEQHIPNALHKYARYARTKESPKYDFFDNGLQTMIYGPNLYCFSLSSAVNPNKEIKSITFKHGANTEKSGEGGYRMFTAIFAVSGSQCALTPKAPTDTLAKTTPTSTTISFRKVTQNVAGQAISGVTYEYVISSTPEYKDSLEYGNLEFTENDGIITAVLDTNWSGKYIRVRAKNNVGYSKFVPVPIIHKLTILPYENGTVSCNYTNPADSTFADQTSVTLEATADTKYTFLHWEDEEKTLITKDNPYVFTIKYDVTIHPVFDNMQVSDGDGKTLTEAKKEVNNKLTSWLEECADSTAINLTINRKIYKDGYYNTLCVPFNLTAEQIAETFEETPKELKQYVSATVTGEGDNRLIEITLKDTTAIVCGKAYLISFNDGGTTLTELLFKDVVVLDTAALTAAKSGNMSYQGIFAPYHLEDNNKNLLFLGDKNKLYWPNDDGTFMKGFRAYFDVTTSQQAPTSPYKRGMKAVFGDKKTPTDIVNEYENENENEIRKLVEQGRVVIVTNGKKYDLQGKLLE